jgi:hypothetical protein
MEKESPGTAIRSLSLDRWWISVRRRSTSHVAQFASQKSMSAIVWSHLICRNYVAPSASPGRYRPSDLGGTRINPNSSAPRQRSTARTVWVIATRDGVLQAESGELGRTGTTWTDCQVGLHGATGLSKPFPSCAPWPTHDGSWPHRERGVC